MNKLLFLLIIAAALLMSSCHREATIKKADKEIEEQQVWLYQHKGKQCASPRFSTLSHAAREVKSLHLEVLRSKEVNIPTCNACDCPTSEVYAVEVLSRELELNMEKLTNAGWQVANQQMVQTLGLQSK